MRDRLIELIKESFDKPKYEFYTGGRNCAKGYVSAETIADYLLDNGIIVPPCKVGDELFVHHRTFKGKIVKGVCIGYTWWRTDGFCIMFHSDTPNYGKVDIAFSDFGKTVFLTKEEAEKALAELKGTEE